MRKATHLHLAFGSIVAATLMTLLAPFAAAQPDPGTFTINHFNVYLNQNPISTGEAVILIDQFGESDHILGPLEKYGVPVDKNFEGFADPRAHLTWWRLSDNVVEPFRTVVVQNQFGDYTLGVFNSEYLLAPALKNAPSQPLPDTHDHYKCYRVEGDEIPFGAQLFDQFSQENLGILTPLYLCNPAEKLLVDGTGFPITKPTEHLVCYLLAQSDPANIVVVAEDQFGVWSLALTERELLCVPSLKDQVVQTNEGSWGEIKSIYR